jgi:hypothetical protein
LQAIPVLKTGFPDPVIVPRFFLAIDAPIPPPVVPLTRLSGSSAYVFRTDDRTAPRRAIKKGIVRPPRFVTRVRPTGSGEYVFRAGGEPGGSGRAPVAGKGAGGSPRPPPARLTSGGQPHRPAGLRGAALPPGSPPSRPARCRPP